MLTVHHVTGGSPYVPLDNMIPKVFSWSLQLLGNQVDPETDVQILTLKICLSLIDLL